MGWGEDVDIYSLERVEQHRSLKRSLVDPDGRARKQFTRREGMGSTQVGINFAQSSHTVPTLQRDEMLLRWLKVTETLSRKFDLGCCEGIAIRRSQP